VYAHTLAAKETEMSELKSKEGLEIKHCSRCGGSGKFSFNLMHGSRCYGCQGSGYQYTPRGKAAKAHLDQLMSVPVSSLKPGDLVYADALSRRGFMKVIEVKVGPAKSLGSWQVGHEDEPSCLLVLDGLRWHVGSPDTLVRKGWSGEAKAEFFAKAQAYQATLTKLGKPAKRKQPAAVAA
jgi:hypothetical protein